MLKTRQRPKPSCPLCRSPAPRASKVDALQVDSESAARVRQSVGFSAYMSQRRKLWAAAVETPEDLEAMPIYCTGLNTKKLRFGRRIGLRFSEPRCCEIVKRAMAPGGSRRFAAVTRSKKGDEISIGARGCLFEIVESSDGTDGLCQVIVETGSACKVLAVRAEGMDQGPPLLIGKLEEFEEDEEDEDDDDNDAGEDEAMVLDEEEQLGLLRERVQLLELLNTAMELEQARLEQRRLELTMLLSQRRLYQELIEMRSELGDLVSLAGALPTMTHASGRRSRRHPEGTGSAYTPSDQSRTSSYAARSAGTSTSVASSRLVESQSRSHPETDQRSHVQISRNAVIGGALFATQARPALHTISLNVAAEPSRDSRTQTRRAPANSEASQRQARASNTFADVRATLRNAAASGHRSSTSSNSMRNTHNRNMHM